MNRKIVFSPGEYYHVYNRGVEKRQVFLSAADYQRFQKLLYLCNGTKSIIFRLVQGETLYTKDVGKKLVDIGAYALMSNHFHILIREKDDNGITELMRKVTTAYTMYFNKKYKRVGPLFQGAFCAEHVDDDNYLKYLFSYIHLNPIKIIAPHWKEEGIGDAQHAEKYLNNYAYSSYVDYLGKNRPEANVLAPKEFPEYFESEHEFADFHREWLTYRNETEFMGKKAVAPTSFTNFEKTPA